MSLSRQDMTLESGRANQKARTRGALLDAAAALVREGRPPSVPEAAERARISVATAYRYFSSADDLWFEASEAAAELEPTLAEVDADIVAAGPDPIARLEVAIRGIGFLMLDDQATFRRMAQGALTQWFAQVGAKGEGGDPIPVREGRRNRSIALVVEPLRGRLPDSDVDRVAHALGVVIGTDAMLALTDGVGLDTERAKDAMLDAGRWLLNGALAELDPN